MTFENPTPANTSTIHVNTATINISQGGANPYYASLDFNQQIRLNLPFDIINGGNIPLDNSSYGVALEMFSNPTQTNFGKFGKAFNFDGLDDNFNTSLILNFDDFTISIWLNKSNTAVTTGRIIVDGRASLNSGAYLWQRGNTSATISVGACVLNAGFMNDSQWHHVVATYSNSTDGSLKLYIDGLLDQSGYCSINLADQWKPVRIGTRTYPPLTFNYSGQIDDLIIMNRSISAGEVSALYDSYIVPYDITFSNLADDNYTIFGSGWDTPGNSGQTPLQWFIVDYGSSSTSSSSSSSSLESSTSSSSSSSSSFESSTSSSSSYASLPTTTIIICNVREDGWIDNQGSDYWRDNETLGIVTNDTTRSYFEFNIFELPQDNWGFREVYFNFSLFESTSEYCAFSGYTNRYGENYQPSTIDNQSIMVAPTQTYVPTGSYCGVLGRNYIELSVDTTDDEALLDLNQSWFAFRIFMTHKNQSIVNSSESLEPECIVIAFVSNPTSSSSSYASSSSSSSSSAITTTTEETTTSSSEISSSSSAASSGMSSSSSSLESSTSSSTSSSSSSSFYASTSSSEISSSSSSSSVLSIPTTTTTLCPIRLMLMGGGYNFCLNNETTCYNPACLENTKDYFGYLKMAEYNPFTWDEITYLLSYFIYTLLFLSFIVILMLGLFGSLVKWND